MAYSKQFKEQAMRLVTERQYTPTAAARELGIPDNTLTSWLKKAGWTKPDKAREYYQKVIDKFPDTEYAEQAKQALGKLQG